MRCCAAIAGEVPSESAALLEVVRLAIANSDSDRVGSESGEIGYRCMDKADVVCKQAHQYTKRLPAGRLYIFNPQHLVTESGLFITVIFPTFHLSFFILLYT